MVGLLTEVTPLVPMQDLISFMQDARTARSLSSMVGLLTEATPLVHMQDLISFMQDVRTTKSLLYGWVVN